MIYTGSCHCKKVRFEVEAPRQLEVERCNCSICSMSGYLHLIVPRVSFKLLTDESELTTYSFNTGTAQHQFCKTCGIKSFYVPRTNPDGIDVNCLEPTPSNMRIVAFDGQNWEQHGHKLAHKSKQP